MSSHKNVSSEILNFWKYSISIHLEKSYYLLLFTVMFKIVYMVLNTHDTKY